MIAQERARLLDGPYGVPEGAIAVGEPRELEGAKHPTTERSYRLGDQLELVMWSQRAYDAGVHFTSELARSPAPL